MPACCETQGSNGARDARSLISIIDDDESLREAIGGLVSWLGHRFHLFSSAPEFLNSPDVTGSSCVIADIQMPQMTGVELHNRLMELGHRIPMILITAYPNEVTRDRALADGVICYLSKPFDKDDLIACVNAALNSRRG